MAATLGKGLDLVEAAENLLAWIVGHWNAAPSDVEPLPARQVMAAGDPRLIAWDCDQLVVALQGIGYGPAQDSPTDSMRSGSPAGVVSVRHAVLVVQLVRCIPTPDQNGGISPEAIHAAGRRFLRDSGMISQAVTTYAAQVRQGLDRKTESILPGVVDPVGPNGDKVGVETTLAITVADLV